MSKQDLQAMTDGEWRVWVSLKWEGLEDRLAESLVDHETRLRLVEKAQIRNTWGVGVLGTALGALTAWILKIKGLG